MYNSHNLAIMIKTRAKEQKVVIKDMLVECELGSNTMSALYHGKSIAFDSLAKIADYLNVSVDYLLGRTDCSEVNRLKTADNSSASTDYLLGADTPLDRFAIARVKTRELYEQQQPDFADIEAAFGINIHTFKAWLAGAGEYFNSPDKIGKIAEFFGVSTDYLVGNTDDPTHQKKVITAKELTAGEQALLDIYRSMNDAGRQRMTEYANTLLTDSQFDDTAKFSIDLGPVERDAKFGGAPFVSRTPALTSESFSDDEERIAAFGGMADEDDSALTT